MLKISNEFADEGMCINASLSGREVFSDESVELGNAMRKERTVPSLEAGQDLFHYQIKQQLGCFSRHRGQ